MQGGRVGFLSTPSIYFSLPDDVRKNCFVFDVRVSFDFPCVMETISFPLFFYLYSLSDFMF